MMGEKRYTPRGTTWKKCHGCGREVNHAIDAVCNDCRRKLDTANAIIAREQRRDDVQEVPIPRSESSMPFYYGKGTNNLAPHTKQGYTVGAALYRIVQLLSQPADSAWNIAHPRNWDGTAYQRMLFPHPRGRLEHTDVALMTPAAFAALRELDAAILALTQQAYLDGIDEGASLLVRLAAGEITVGQFNALSVGERRS